jgi:hypothetical protein
MQFEILDRAVEVQTQELPSSTSLHTGRSLRVVVIELVAVPNRVEELNDFFESSRGGSRLIADGDGGKWVVTNSSYSYSNDGPRRFSVQLVEHEELTVERLHLLGLDVVPRYYREDVDTGRLVLTAEVISEGEQDARLEEAVSSTEGYFDVLRLGISDDPIRVRFGRCLWQKGDSPAERIHSLVLVAEGGDEEDDSGHLINQPELGNAAQIAIVARELGECIVDELVRAGALDESARARIQERAETAFRRRYRDLLEAGDVTRYR